MVTFSILQIDNGGTILEVWAQITYKMETNGNISCGKSHIKTYHIKELVKKKTLRAVLGNLDKKK